MIAGVISAVAGAVVIGLGLWLWRRRNREQSKESPQPPPATARDLEHDPRLEPQRGTGSVTAAILNDGGQPSPQDRGPSQPPDARPPAVSEASGGDDDDDDGIVSTSDAVAAPVGAAVVPAALREPAPARAPAPAPAPVPELAPTPDPAQAAAIAKPPQAISSNPDQKKTSGKDAGPALGSESAKDLAAEQCFTASMSTAERAELGQFHGRRASAASVADKSAPGDAGDGLASSASGRRGSRGGIDLREAVMEAAENLAYHCQIPGVSEAASVVSTLAKLVSDGRDIKSGGDTNLRQCRSIVRMLERASTVAGKVGIRGLDLFPFTAKHPLC